MCRQALLLGHNKARVQHDEEEMRRIEQNRHT
jgi:hypothetical protein